MLPKAVAGTETPPQAEARLRQVQEGNAEDTEVAEQYRCSLSSHHTRSCTLTHVLAQITHDNSHSHLLIWICPFISVSGTQQSQARSSSVGSVNMVSWTHTHTHAHSRWSHTPLYTYTRYVSHT